MIFITPTYFTCVYNLYNQKDTAKLEAGRHFNIFYDCQIPNNFLRLGSMPLFQLQKLWDFKSWMLNSFLFQFIFLNSRIQDVDLMSVCIFSFIILPGVLWRTGYTCCLEGILSKNFIKDELKP